MMLRATVVALGTLSGCSDSAASGTGRDAGDAALTDGAPADGGASQGSGGRSAGGASSGGASNGGAGGAAPGPDAAVPFGGCERLPVTGRVVELSPSDDLVEAVRGAAPGDTLSLADGTYPLGGKILQLRTDHVTLRGKSGDREAVVLDGERSAASGEVVSVTASDVTIAHLTIANAYTHAIHVQATDAGDVLRTSIFDVHVRDALEQGIKINLNVAESHFPDDGTISCSRIELTSGGRGQVRNNCYTGGIDAHGARGWKVRDNVIEGFYCSEGLSEHGVHFWTGSRDTIVERNRISNCARGVGFGLGETTSSSSDVWRTYADSPCGGAAPVGHYGGIVRNNFIFANDPALFASQSGFDSGIGLEQACAATVVHNTIFGTTPPLSSAVEWRFGNTSVTVKNNLANAPFKNRGGGATGTEENDATDASAATFVDAARGDLHLAGGIASLPAASPLSPGIADDDIDGDARTDPRDVGADEAP